MLGGAVLETQEVMPRVLQEAVEGRHCSLEALEVQVLRVGSICWKCWRCWR